MGAVLWTEKCCRCDQKPAGLYDPKDYVGPEVNEHMRVEMIDIRAMRDQREVSRARRLRLEDVLSDNFLALAEEMLREQRVLAGV